jgi:hypothetical protein
MDEAIETWALLQPVTPPAPPSLRQHRPSGRGSAGIHAGGRPPHAGTLPPAETHGVDTGPSVIGAGGGPPPPAAESCIALDTEHPPPCVWAVATPPRRLWLGPLCSRRRESVCAGPLVHSACAGATSSGSGPEYRPSDLGLPRQRRPGVTAALDPCNYAANVLDPRGYSVEICFMPWPYDGSRPVANPAARVDTPESISGTRADLTASRIAVGPAAASQLCPTLAASPRIAIPREATSARGISRRGRDSLRLT